MTARRAVIVLVVLGAIAALVASSGSSAPAAMTRLDVPVYVRFGAEIVPGSDMLDTERPRTAISVRDAGGRVVRRLSDPFESMTNIRVGSYTVRADLSRPPRRSGHCETKVKATGRRTVVTLIVGANHRCDLYGGADAAIVRVPDLAELAPEDAACVLRATGLRMKLYGSHGGLGRGCPPLSQDADIVLAVQQPAAGSSLRRGSAVEVGIDCADLPHGCHPLTARTSAGTFVFDGTRDAMKPRNLSADHMRSPATGERAYDETVLRGRRLTWRGWGSARAVGRGRITFCVIEYRGCKTYTGRIELRRRTPDPDAEGLYSYDRARFVIPGVITTPSLLTHNRYR